jgi:hypothetical protein
MSGTPTTTLGRLLVQELRIAYRARAPRRRSPHSSRRWGKPITWRRGAGERWEEGVRSARCRTTDPRTLRSLESRMLGNWHVRFGGGRLEKVLSPVARYCRCIRAHEPRYQPRTSPGAYPTPPREDAGAEGTRAAAPNEPNGILGNLCEDEQHGINRARDGRGCAPAGWSTRLGRRRQGRAGPRPPGCVSLAGALPYPPAIRVAGEA